LDTLLYPVTCIKKIEQKEAPEWWRENGHIIKIDKMREFERS
jgi:hypothetical protein